MGKQGNGVKGRSFLSFSPIHLSPFHLFTCTLEAMKGVEPLSSGLQDRRSFYPIELHRRKQRSEVGGQKSEVGSRRSEVGGRKSEVGSRKSEVGDRNGATGQRSAAKSASAGWCSRYMNLITLFVQR